MVSAATTATATFLRTILRRIKRDRVTPRWPQPSLRPTVSTPTLTPTSNVSVTPPQAGMDSDQSPCQPEVALRRRRRCGPGECSLSPSIFGP
jgi:hypothetical protein